MKAISTQDGFVYWGIDDEDVVTKMRRAAFFDRHTTNRAFIKTIADRLASLMTQEETRRLSRANASEFLNHLARLELISDVTDRFTCPVLNRFCESKDEKCGNGECAFKPHN
jgi:hypothetical protein